MCPKLIFPLLGGIGLGSGLVSHTKNPGFSKSPSQIQTTKNQGNLTTPLSCRGGCELATGLQPLCGARRNEAAEDGAHHGLHYSDVLEKTNENTTWLTHV